MGGNLPLVDDQPLSRLWFGKIRGSYTICTNGRFINQVCGLASKFGEKEPTNRFGWLSQITKGGRFGRANRSAQLNSTVSQTSVTPEISHSVTFCLLTIWRRQKEVT